MKKILSFFLIATMLLSFCGCDTLIPLLKELESAIEENNTQGNCSHVDEDKDEMCDDCYLYLGEDCPHMDENQDGLCDYCGNEWEYVCENHYDEQLDGICDYCDNTFTKVPLDTPSIYIDDEGLVSWYKREIYQNCNKYILSINGVEKEVSSTTLKSPAHGDVIRVKALAINEKGMYLDSEWSEEYTYQLEKQYDFLGIGLTGEMEKALIRVYDKEAGTYTIGDTSYIICKNGDLIIDEGVSEGRKLTMYTQSVYEMYTIFDDCYDLTRFGKNNKYQYYSGVYLISAMFSLLQNSTDTVWDSASSYLSNKNVTLLVAGEHGEGIDGGGYPLSTYTEHSGTINTDYLFATYMHPETRKFGWLAPFADKIQSWSILYVGDVWIEGQVNIIFKPEFTKDDCKAMQTVLKGYGLSGSGLGDLEDILGGMNPDELDNLLGGSVSADDLFGQISGSGMGSFEGSIPVYIMPFEHEGDAWYDDYNMVGMVSEEYTMPFTLSIQYLYKYWYDGGSFATYVLRKEGLYRYTNDEGQLVIDKEGNRLY